MIRCQRGACSVGDCCRVLPSSFGNDCVSSAGNVQWGRSLGVLFCFGLDGVGSEVCCKEEEELDSSR